MDQATKSTVAQIYDELGRPGVQILLQGLRRRGVKVPKKQVEEFVKSQSEVQVLARRRNFGGKNTALKRDDRWQMDLMEYSTADQGFKYVLVVVDVFSRKVAAEALRSKRATEVWEAFRKIMTRLGGKPKLLISDEGGEFQGPFEKNIRDLDINHVETDPRNPNAHAIVDSAIDRIRKIIAKFLVSKKKESWLEELPKAVDAINIRPLESLASATPNEVGKNSALEFLLRVNRGQDLLQNNRAMSALQNELRRTGRFRVLNNTSSFDKEGKPTYSKEVHYVSKIEGNVVTSQAGDEYNILFVRPVKGEGAEMIDLPKILTTTSKDIKRREILQPYAEALKVRLRALESLTLSIAGTYLSTIPGWKEALTQAKLTKEGVRGMIQLYPETFGVRGEGSARRVILRLAA